MMIEPVKPDQNQSATAQVRDSTKVLYDEEDFKSRLWDEYKLLQDKIDKIGAFRFTIKGWSITAVIAASAAGSGKGLSTVCTISLGLVLMLVFFFLLEHEQVRWSRLFGNRADGLKMLSRKSVEAKGRRSARAFPVPYTAHELVLAGHRKGFFDRNPEAREPRDPSKEREDKWHSLRQAHVAFLLSSHSLSHSPLVASPPRHSRSVERVQGQSDSGFGQNKQWLNNQQHCAVQAGGFLRKSPRDWKR